MTETAKNKGFLIKTLADPVLIYVVILVMSIMYHYRDTLTAAYGIAAYALGWLIFRLFDFMKKHNVIGGAVYIAMLFVSIRLAGAVIERGQQDYPITFLLWFMTPQDSLLYNKWYTLAMFVFFFVFMASVFYYFTRCRYRVFMTFLIMMIPFVIYGKEYEEMPVYFILALSVGYVLLMIMFRQLNENKDTVIIDKRETWRSVGIFTAMFALAAAFIPKPAVEADRSVLETLINADALTDRLNEMLNVFRDTATGEQFRSTDQDTIHYYGSAEEPLRLKTSTFSTYSYETDSWSISDLDSYYSKHEDLPINIYVNGEIADAVFFAADEDEDFAQKYGLSEYAGVTLEYPQPKEVSLFSVYQGGNSAPVPQGAYTLTETSYNGVIGLTRAGAILTDEGYFNTNDRFKFTYIPDRVFDNANNKALIDMLGSRDDYFEMLRDAFEVVKEARDNYFITTEQYAQADRFFRTLMSSCNYYEDYTSILLDYGDNERIRELAAEITDGLTSDYDKAKALEWYFINNGYVYDLDYRKEKGDNAEDFLFDSKTGVCYEYATAMTLLSRAAGIPARYCEGYNMQTELEQYRDENGVEKRYTITSKDAHGFPELYIKGFGWVTFEPTMSLDAQSDGGRQASSMLSKMGLIILAICGVMLIIVFVSPFLIHRSFIFINRKKSPEQAAAAVIRRICRLYGISASSTAREAEKEVMRRSGADISAAVLLFERAEYGGEKLSENDREEVIKSYNSAYKALAEAKKAERKIKLRRKKIK